ncbi:MAG TPA: hypothetical protein VL485_06340 [Ktedonobacteraceae bacterium]|nr:hypothetical protein [Ktedonobacteraceae bacterium]
MTDQWDAVKGHGTRFLWHANPWKGGERHVCGANGIERVPGRHSAAASWRPYWPGGGTNGCDDV